MIHRAIYAVWLVLVLFFSMPVIRGASSSSNAIHKLRDVIIYRDATFYSSFPSMVRRSNGELVVAFRRAPDRRNMLESGYRHTDPNSHLVLVRSRDDGQTWTQTPELIYAHPFGGSQDPCMIQLRDGSIICSSYAWGWFPKAVGPEFATGSRINDYCFLGGFMVRSTDGGHTWQGPIIPPSVPTERVTDVFHKPVPAFNRGAMAQGKDGRVYWATASKSSPSAHTSDTHLFISSDNGESWNYSCRIATDEKTTFNETSMYETPKGDLVAFMRTGNFGDHTVIARSTNHGKSFLPWQDASFQGHPHYALRLPDKRVLLVYGYRHVPFGVRARVLDAECTDFSGNEIILREDGGNSDLGYPWAVLLSKTRALVVYYFNEKDGPRYIAGTVLALK